MKLSEPMDCDNVDCFELADSICDRCGQPHCQAHAEHPAHGGVPDAPSDPSGNPQDLTEPLNPA